MWNRLYNQFSVKIFYSEFKTHSSSRLGADTRTQTKRLDFQIGHVHSFVISTLYRLMLIHKNIQFMPTCTKRYHEKKNIWNNFSICRIRGSHHSSYECCHLLGIESCSPYKNDVLEEIITSISRIENQPSKKQVIRFFKTSVQICTKRCYNQEDGKFSFSLVLKDLYIPRELPLFITLYPWNSSIVCSIIITWLAILRINTSLIPFNETEVPSRCNKSQDF
jgi:hypothetical protein